MANAENQRRPRDREKTIEHILDAAEKLLEERGPDGFGLAELGKTAGISFGLIHHYFGGKEGLLRAVLQRALGRMGDEIRRIEESGGYMQPDAPAVLVVFDTFTNRPGFARTVAWGLLTGLITSEEIANEFRRDAEAVEAMIDHFRDEAPPHIRDDASYIALLIMSSVLGFNLMRPLLTSAFGWTQEHDADMKRVLASAMAGLTKSSRRDD